ncbi:hypothetical protein SODALDRAFT_351170 [Sodiomyces alkalinus F11]|uniref:Uncharacterized protein n=1 Tax=Sodiomyces alkalinus (strain CBS 110278 / VKM F-3762 / F11) TaxID=1314773 RepID=A0A3N2PU09_SODAK|nr:hypothetical protein SODALDRAFT_351170 [Sodiomyces alkalinus F11]ROT37998.1 hypothetical protein SODALDRAFT_351170 [Sodiomyces alkalinus F11]
MSRMSSPHARAFTRRSKRTSSSANVRSFVSGSRKYVPTKNLDTAAQPPQKNPVLRLAAPVARRRVQNVRVDDAADDLRDIVRDPTEADALVGAQPSGSTPRASRASSRPARSSPPRKRPGPDADEADHQEDHGQEAQAP